MGLVFIFVQFVQLNMHCLEDFEHNLKAKLLKTLK